MNLATIPEPENGLSPPEHEDSPNDHHAERITASGHDESLETRHRNEEIELERLPTVRGTTSSQDGPKALESTLSNTRPPDSLALEIPFLFTLCLAQLLAQAGLAQSIAPLHIIGDSFGTRDPGQLSWMPAAYSLTVGTFILIAGRLGDLFGHKEMFIAGYVWYALWSLLAGVSVWSTTPVFFNVCRAFQGIGPAFSVPSAIAIIGRTYPFGRRKSMIFSVFGATAPGGFVLGAGFSSLFVQLAWWPWAYWVMAAVCCIVAAAAVLVIPSSPPRPSPRPRPRTTDLQSQGSMWDLVDVPGAVTGVVGLVLVNFAWNQGAAAGWQTPYVYTLLVVGFLVLGVFAWIETRAKFPLLPREILTGPLGFVLACIGLGWSSFGIWLFYLWQILEQIRGETPLMASAQFSAVAVSGACAAFTTGMILGRLRPSMVMYLAMMAFTVGAILVAVMPARQTYWAQTFISIIVMPWGMDMSFPAATIILSGAMRKEHQGLAASLVNTVINYSISIGLGIAGTVQSQVSPGTSKEDLLRGCRSAFYVGIGLSGLGVVTAVLFVLYEKKRDGDERTQRS